METERFIKPVAYIHTGFKEKFGIPRQSGRVEEALGRIVFAEGYRDSEALREIKGFSHLWLIFSFSELQHDKWTPTVRPPRLGGNKKVGVFASRSPFRPNGLGLSSVRLLGVETTEKEGTVLIVSGADLLDGTPIYDIKPYIAFSDCHNDAVSGYAEDNRNHRPALPHHGWRIEPPFAFPREACGQNLPRRGGWPAGCIPCGGFRGRSAPVRL